MPCWAFTAVTSKRIANRSRLAPRSEAELDLETKEPEITASTIPESGGQSVLDCLGVAEDPLTTADPVSFLRSLLAAGLALSKNPLGVAAANGRLAIGMAAAARAAAEGMFGRQMRPRISKGQRQTIRRSCL